jgi:hypothetical protein
MIKVVFLVYVYIVWSLSHFITSVSVYFIEFSIHFELLHFEFAALK